MPKSRRHLPHIHEIGHPIFLTWRLHGTLPAHLSSKETLTSGQAFAAIDNILDHSQTGPHHLKNPHIANMIVEAIHYNGYRLNHYKLHAYVIMSNHVHLLITPKVPLPKLTQSLKGITAKRANEILNRTGQPFWQEETYDHHIRNGREFNKIRIYIEQNPVKAGLATEPAQYPWSSSCYDRNSPQV